MIPDPLIVDLSETTTDAPVANGSTPTVRVVQGQRSRQKVARCELSGDFEGVWLMVWTNPKRKLVRDFDEADGRARDGLIGTLVLDHNLTDDAGELYPKPLTPEALGDMEMDLYNMVCAGILQAVQAANELPKA